MEEREAMTLLTLGTGASSEHSKSNRSSVCEPKLPVQFHDLFCAQSLEEKDSIFVKMEKECNIGEKSRCRSLEDQEDSDSSNGQARKKLRLNEEQLTVLETVYKQHSNIDPAVKQELAEQLTIKPRQVEVWFQNRRARSKQKQTEADRENLKRWCEGLNNENQRLKRELQELMSVSHTSSLPLHGKAHNGSNVDIICPPCNKIVKKYSQPQ